ncbi:hypothetical protein EVA_02030 [gut metagenome]|uniref:Uncharacterized protein n=1 Tax=gut metagenome TaxID=749906 RepID=J9GNX3_9ZZZZ
MIFHGYTVISQDIDLFGNFLTTLQTRLDFIHLANPVSIDTLSDVILKFRIFYVFGIGINGVYSRITFSISTVLFQSIEAASHLLGIFSNRFLQVTSCRRYSTDKGNGSCFTVVEYHITCTPVEVGNDRRQVHRESIRSGQLFHTIGHLTQSLCPARSRISHQQHLKSHAPVIFSNSHSRINRCFTSRYRHVGSIGNDNGTLHQFAPGMRVHQFRKFRKDFYYLIGTFTTSRNNNDIRFCLFGNGMLQHCLSRSERTGDKPCTTFHYWIDRINDTYTRFQQFERTRFFTVIRHSLLYRPFLNHVHLNIFSFLILQHSNRIFNGVITLLYDRFHGTYPFLFERHHDFQRLEILLYLTQPGSSFHLIPYLYQGDEMPYASFIQWIGILTTF